MTDAHIERHNGSWYMIIGEDASPIGGVTEMVLNQKATRMLEAQKIGAVVPITARVPGDITGGNPA